MTAAPPSARGVEETAVTRVLLAVEGLTWCRDPRPRGRRDV